MIRSPVLGRARIPYLRSAVSWFISLFLAVLALAWTNQSAHAQGAATGTITGRVINAATRQYLKNAQVELLGSGQVATTEDGGVFTFRDVPAGEAKIAVTYTGLDRLEQTVLVPSGSTASQEFALKSSAYDDSTITMGKYVVSTEREGNAKAIVDQKHAVNVKTVIASDAFGDVAEGNVGEFLKLLPGITVDYVDADVRAVRVRGLPPKYASFTIDGHPVAASASSSIDTGRQFEFEQVSLATLDVVEVNKSPMADMMASNLSGNINTISKSALNSKGRVLKYSANVTINQYGFTLDKTLGWDNEKHYKALPGGSIEFSDTFLNGKLGLVAAANHSGSYAEQRIVIGSTIFDRNPNNNQTELPLVSQWNFQHGLKPTFRDSIVLNLDYKATDELSLSLRTSYNYYDAEFYNRNWLVNANTTGMAFNADGTLNQASLTGISGMTERSAQSASAAANNSALSYAGVQGSNFHKFGGTFIGSPSLTWKHDNLRLDTSVSYSQSRNSYDSGNDGFFSAVVARMPGFSWNYTIDGDTGVKIRQVTTAASNNVSVLDLANYTANATVNNETRRAKDQFWTANADFQVDMDKWKVPTKIKVGADTRLNVRDISNFNPQWVLNTNPTTAGGINLGNYQEAFRPDIEQGTSITDLNGVTGKAPSPDKWRLYDLFQSGNTNPFATTASGAFTAAAPANFRNLLQNQFDIKETIFSTYAMGTLNPTRQLTLLGGLRYEQTESQGRAFDDIGHARASVLAGTTNTNDFGYIYKRYGNRVTRTQKYDNLFPSAQIRYEPRKNLVVRGAYFSSILRPDFSSLAGGVSVTENSAVPPYTFNVRNTELKPETANNYDVQLEYYFEPVGVVSLGAFYKDIKKIQIQISSFIDPNAIPTAISDLGYTASDIGSNSTIVRRINGGDSSIWGLEANYQQELRFLPGALRGLGVTVNLTYVNPENENLFTAASGGDGIAKYSANFILRYKYHKLSTQVSANWTDTRVTGLSGISIDSHGVTSPLAGVNNSNRYEYNYQRLVFGYNVNYAFTRYATVFLNINNFTNNPQFRYVERHPYTSRYGLYGATFNLGVKGNF